MCGVILARCESDFTLCVSWEAEIMQEADAEAGNPGFSMTKLKMDFASFEKLFFKV